MAALTHFSDIDLLGYGERVINLDSEIANRALNLRVAKQSPGYNLIVLQFEMALKLNPLFP